MKTKLEITIKTDNSESAQGVLFTGTPTQVIEQALDWLESNARDAFWEAIGPYR